MTSAPRETIVVDGLALARSIRQELAESVARHVADGQIRTLLSYSLILATLTHGQGKCRAALADLISYLGR